jgi:hypothetical protein
VVSAEPAWDRALELAWESFCGGTTPVGAVVTDAGADPYGGTGTVVFGTPQARHRPLPVTGPLTDERGRLSELLHITWIMRVAGPHVLAPQQEFLPHQAALAARAATQRLLTEAAAARIPLPDLRTALAGLL